MYGDEEDEPEWTHGPEFQMWAQQQRWEAYANVRINTLLAALPPVGAPIPRLPSWRQQVFWRLKRWR